MKKSLFALLFIPYFAHTLEPESRTMPKNGIDKALLGQILFFDKTLSLQGNLNCASCHDPDHAFIDVRETKANKMVSQGDDLISFGKRNSPTMLYAKFSPEFHFDPKEQTYVGGQFWDGRAHNLQEQAGKPPLDPNEMAMPDKLSVAQRLWQTPMYAALFTQHYGKEVWQTVDSVYAAMENLLATFQNEKKLLAPFDSNYDKSLNGDYRLNDLEAQGKALFFDRTKTSCANCHQRNETPDQAEETFSNYHYYNVGVPSNKRLISLKNLQNDTLDFGLFENPSVNGDEQQKGKFKVPTLRNVAVTAPYMHNGVFNELRTAILYFDHFNNPERQINPETGEPWQEPEFAATIEREKLGGKPLSDQEIDAIEAFLKTLTDERYLPLLQ